jgi:hypothetical protein
MLRPKPDVRSGSGLRLLATLLRPCRPQGTVRFVGIEVGDALILSEQTYL